MRYFFTVALLCFSVTMFAQNPIFYLMVGTYTKPPGKSQGIYVYKFNPNKGVVTPVSNIAADNPSYLTVSKDQHYVYCVNELNNDKGAASAFSFDKQKGELHFINSQPTGGDDPAYIAIDSTGKWLVTANYSGGNISVFKTGDGGALQPATQVLAHQGYGVNVTRQEQPHPHEAVFSPDGKFVYVPDLGNDRLYSYSFDANSNTAPLTPTDPPYGEIADGSGPRHITFSPDGKFAYLINELSGDVISYQYNNGKLTQIQTIVSTDAGEKNDRGSAEIDMTPDGKFLYTSNRGKANDITIFKPGTDGKLVMVGHQPVGAHPRHFMIDPTGRFLVVACRDSNAVQFYVINKNYGLLTDAGFKIDIDQPVCLKMIPVK